jgi:hypothetical protein
MFTIIAFVSMGLIGWAALGKTSRSVRSTS